jgi:hypothetical protein
MVVGLKNVGWMVLHFAVKLELNKGANKMTEERKKNIEYKRFKAKDDATQEERKYNQNKKHFEDYKKHFEDLASGYKQDKKKGRVIDDVKKMKKGGLAKKEEGIGSFKVGGIVHDRNYLKGR